MNKIFVPTALLIGGYLEGSDIQGFEVPDFTMAAIILISAAMLIHTLVGGDK